MAKKLKNSQKRLLCVIRHKNRVCQSWWKVTLWWPPISERTINVLCCWPSNSASVASYLFPKRSHAAAAVVYTLHVGMHFWIKTNSQRVFLTFNYLCAVEHVLIFVQLFVFIQKCKHVNNIRSVSTLKDEQMPLILAQLAKVVNFIGGFTAFYAFSFYGISNNIAQRSPLYLPTGFDINVIIDLRVWF